MSDDLDQNQQAQILVGKFLQKFAILESSLDRGIGRLLGLDTNSTDIVCSNIILSRKVDVFFSAEAFVGELPDEHREALLKDTRNGVMELNDKRNMFAHNPFTSDTPQTVNFRRVVTNRKLKVSQICLTSDEINELCVRTQLLTASLDRLVTEIKPYKPKLDFSDPRNSMYLAIV